MDNKKTKDTGLTQDTDKIDFVNVPCNLTISKEDIKTELKQKITAILVSAVNGSDYQYRLRNGHTDWGLVEKHIHMLIDDL
jgi:hypothetical protein